ncbi:MAG: hypothetical protein GX130_14375 [Candidatus Hydrogenedens sp.]|nr:hypothetical protein [Candidatus Hydrogenedens sp.]
MKLEFFGKIMYFGESYTILDGKKRLVIPVALRRIMEEKNHRIWYITRTYDQSLFMFTEEHWERILVDVAKNPLDPEADAFKRFFLGPAIKVEADAQWRIALNDGLKDYARLDRECVILGVDQYLEIWSKMIWADYSLQKMGEYKEQAKAIFARNNALHNPQEEAAHVNG